MTIAENRFIDAATSYFRRKNNQFIELTIPGAHKILVNKNTIKSVAPAVDKTSNTNAMVCLIGENAIFFTTETYEQIKGML